MDWDFDLCSHVDILYFLEFESAKETVETPFGTFEGCLLYVTRQPTENGARTYKNYFRFKLILKLI